MNIYLKLLFETQTELRQPFVLSQVSRLFSCHCTFVPNICKILYVMNHLMNQDRFIRG